uniref:Uncharacterized protein n=1 Tax=Rhizophora mucronata TaxID=61149 RepID=A0A2P2MZH1_RHIMU
MYQHIWAFMYPSQADHELCLKHVLSSLYILVQATLSELVIL